MFIIDADRSNTVNVNNVINISVDGKYIIAVTKVDDIVIGSYRTDKRAQEVYAEMLKEAFPPSTWIFQNCSIEFDSGVYYMPEE